LRDRYERYRRCVCQGFQPVGPSRKYILATEATQRTETEGERTSARPAEDANLGASAARQGRAGNRASVPFFLDVALVRGGVEEPGERGRVVGADPHEPTVLERGVLKKLELIDDVGVRLDHFAVDR